MNNTKLIPPRSPLRPPNHSGGLEGSNLGSNGQKSNGFTIIECLMAILVVSILMTAIAPVITLSVGNRVQARRVELATQAARTYINGVASGAIEPPNHTVELNEVDNNQNFVSQRASFAKQAAPLATGSLSCLANTAGNLYCSNTSTSSLYCIDLDGDGCSSKSVKDVLVQAFRSITPTTTNTDSSTNTDRGYLLGIRVYRADGFSDNTPLLKSDSETNRTQATFTGGLGNRKAPLVEMTTEIATNKATMRDFCDRLGCQGTQ